MTRHTGFLRLFVAGNIYVGVEGTAPNEFGDVADAASDGNAANAANAANAGNAGNADDVTLAVDGTAAPVAAESDMDLESNKVAPARVARRNFFDAVTEFAGTAFVLVFTIVALVAWAIVGIVLGPSQVWQIVIQNTSSIQCYVSDTLLMRQQHNNSRDLLTLLCQLRSRDATCLRILDENRGRLVPCSAAPRTPPMVLTADGAPSCGTGIDGIDGIDGVDEPVDKEGRVATGDDSNDSNDSNDSSDIKDSKEGANNDGGNEIQSVLRDAVHLPAHSLYDRLCDPVVTALGSLYAPIIYWAGIFVWLGFGGKLGWDNDWQLYINTAVAVELTFVSVFLQNTRKRHMRYLHQCYHSLLVEDTRMERKMRRLAGDGRVDVQPNPTVPFEFDYAALTKRGNRIIDNYGAVVGTAVGLVISACVFAAWIGIGTVMHWSSNWWLIIGTYTGLIGFLDGFVLRNVYFRANNVLEDAFDVLARKDHEIGRRLGVHLSDASADAAARAPTLGVRVARKISDWCAKSRVVLASLFVILTVIIVASAMHWSETGQLICNSPTMIIEGFMMLVLIQAHDMANSSHRLRFRDLVVRRLEINACLSAMGIRD